MSPAASRRRARAGFSLIESSIAICVLTVGLMAAGMTAVTNADLQQATAEHLAASNAARNVFERLRSGDLTQRYQEFAAAPDFAVGPLQVQVRFPEDLLVQVLGAAPGATATFRDLDGDGEVELDLAATEPASLLPVRVTVTGNGSTFPFEGLVTQK